MKRQKVSSLLLRSCVYLSAGITVAVLVCLVGYMLWQGIPGLKPSLFSWTYSSENSSMMPAIINTLTMTLLALLLSVPLGLGSAIFLVEYANHASPFVRVIRMATETLAGIPSIVYGLFGYLLFNITLGLGYSLLSGILTLSIMVLPTIMRTGEEALLSVPALYREGSFGLGAGRLRTVVRIVLPAAMPGIVSGVILAIGRMVGETAALIFTSGTATGIANITSSGRTLAVHMYALWNEGLHMEAAYATGVVLLVIVVVTNAAAHALSKRLTAQGK